MLTGTQLPANQKSEAKLSEAVLQSSTRESLTAQTRVNRAGPTGIPKAPETPPMAGSLLSHKIRVLRIPREGQFPVEAAGHMPVLACIGPGGRRGIDQRQPSAPEARAVPGEGHGRGQRRRGRLRAIAASEHDRCQLRKARI